MELNKIVLTIATLALFLNTFGQVAENRYLVYFADKEGTPYSVDMPEEFLSQRAITRRQNQNIEITEEDLPVNPVYIQEVLDLGEVELIYPLKWFNAILIETQDPAVIDEIEALSNVVGTQVSTQLTNDENLESEVLKITEGAKDGELYGMSLSQIEMINGLPLHEAGFRGEGVWIGVFDGGFSNAEEALALQNLMNSDRILGTKDFVEGDDDVYHRSNHGTWVLSTMAGVLEGSLIGTAPDASYLLCTTEDVDIERRIEEANWAAAAEYADSVGVDIINTSLGYTEFDLVEENYTYEDLDGNTTLITRASDIAASKGILMVTSAGNSGNSDWYYIGAPADGDQVLAVGATTFQGEVVSFSSRGPRVDGAIKPNVMSRGFQAVATDLQDGIAFVNGTSFASPIIAGMSASLWQAVPNATVQEVFTAIEESAHLYNNPNDSMGYGIPDYELALQSLQTLSNNPLFNDSDESIIVYPNPVNVGQNATLKLPNGLRNLITIDVVDITGKRLFSQQLRVENDLIQLQSSSLSEGLYIISIRGEGERSLAAKLIVQ
jgi:hypothetical protein